MHQKYIIIARIIVIFVALFVIGLAIFHIIKKHWIWLVIHTIISFVLVSFVLWFSSPMGCTSSIPCLWEGCTPWIDPVCATNEGLYKILHPFSKSKQDNDEYYYIIDWYKSQWYEDIEEVYESEWYRNRYQECIDSYRGKRCWVPEQMCTLDRLISGNFCD